VVSGFLFTDIEIADIRFSLSQEGNMARERALKVVLVVVGLLFVATAYPLVAMRLDESLQMMLSLYVTLGIFLLLAARNPSAYRSVIAFAAWSSIAHAAVMTVQGFYDVAERVHFLVGSAMFVLIGVALLAVSPPKSNAVEA
jgi:glutaminase